jgi:uncharacterized protein YcbX
MDIANNPGSDREIGRVKALFRYPVKSMAAEPLDSIEVGFHGFAGDRRYAFVRAGLERSGFPWLTIREKPEMWHYQPRFAEPDRPELSTTIVRTPSGDEFDVVDPALAEELGHGARVIKQSVGVFDTFPLSLITTQAIASIGAMVGTELDQRRFRPNLLIEANDGSGFPEDEWIGAVLRIGGMTMRIDKRDKRCVMINVDPISSERDARILRAVAQERDGRLGVYGSTVVPGTVSAGDRVSLISPSQNY